MNIWLIQPAEPLPIDEDNPRLLRTGLFAQSLVQRGHNITWWASTFRHSTKQHRSLNDIVLHLQENFRLILLRSPGYKNNVSISRLLDHIYLAREFRLMTKMEQVPDVIHCGFPIIELAKEATAYGLKHRVPVIIDVRDMWPDIFLDSLPNSIKFAGKILVHIKAREAKKIFEEATAISGHAPGFVEFGLKYANRKSGVWDRDFPFGYTENSPPNAAQYEALSYWEALGVQPDQKTRTICFFGYFGTQKALDFDTPIEAFKELDRRGCPVRLVLCGIGPQFERLKSLTKDAPNILMPGWVDMTKIWVLMRLSTAGLLPYLPAKDFRLSIPNKSVEYLSSSLPIITSLTEGYLNGILRQAGCGIYYESKRPRELADRIEKEIIESSEKVSQMRENAGLLFKKSFIAENVYSEMADYLEGIANYNKGDK